MAKLDRQTQLIFASSAGIRSLTAFGTAKGNNPVYTDNVSTIQNNNYLNGWDAAILEDKAPYEEDTNALLYMITRQLAYLYQSGIPEYDANTTYYTGNTVAAVDGSGKWYKSLTDNNTGNALSNSTYWQLIELSKRTLPLFSQVTLDYVLQNDDAIGWALQGSKVDGNIYNEAFNKLLNLYNSGTVVNYRGISAALTTDGRYITSLSNKNAVDNLFNNTGVADFYILDTSTSSFYLPKTSKFIQYTTDTTAVNKYTAAGLPAPAITLSGTGNITTNSAGSHNHTRGTQNITGSTTLYGASQGGVNGTGALSGSSATGTRPVGGGSGEDNDWLINFDASKGWTGESSTNGSHTHTLNLNLSASAQGGLYGTNNTVQVASSSKLLYYLVGDTAT